MRIEPATPGSPAVELTHGVGALILALRSDCPTTPPTPCPRCGQPRHSLGTVLTPAAAELLAAQLSDQAAHARAAMNRIHPP